MLPQGWVQNNLYDVPLCYIYFFAKFTRLQLCKKQLYIYTNFSEAPKRQCLKASAPLQGDKRRHAQDELLKKSLAACLRVVSGPWARRRAARDFFQFSLMSVVFFVSPERTAGLWTRSRDSLPLTPVTRQKRKKKKVILRRP